MMAPGNADPARTAPLPVDEALPALRRALGTGTVAVLQAPPGAGKSTRVPLALLAEPWLAGQTILMLEPRRLAARALARYMARLLGEGVGETVGYRVRQETRVGPRTRVEVLTEGVLTRRLQHDPALEGVGLVIFDEFHERSLHADLGLALCLQTRALLRSELRLLVMSATLDGEPVARLLGGAPVVTSAGRAFPVETRYRAQRLDGPLEPAVARAVREALAATAGDVLVFLPGAAEIRRTEALLADAGLGGEVIVAPLHGSLGAEAQDRAVLPAPGGRRKVVLATALAETSLTIEGVRAVVDSGRMRVPRFSPRTGMTRLETVPVTRASAEQRRGRAGRLGPGVCFRLWTEVEQQTLLPFGQPEILAADLAPLALELAAWGTHDPAELSWLDAPPSAAFAQARELLAELGALDADGRLTPHGRRMAELPVHPRLAHLLLRGVELGHGALACALAALLGERDLLRAEGAPPDADLRLRLEALNRKGFGIQDSGFRSSVSSSGVGAAGRRLNRDGDGTLLGHSIERGTLQRVRAEAARLRRQLGVREAQADAAAAGLLLAFAYPDRIAQRRPGRAARYRLRNGRGAALAEPQSLSRSPFLAVAELDGRGREARVFLAAPLEQPEIEAHFAEQIVAEETVAWDAAAAAVRALRRERLGALVLREAPLAEPDPEALAAALLQGLAGVGLHALPWDRHSRQLQQRLVFLHRLDGTWPDGSDEALLAALPEWLGLFVHGLRRLDELQRLDLGDVLLARLSWEQRRALDELAPSHLPVPSGSKIAIDYADPEAPVLAVRLQEVFGLRETPRIAGGRVPLTLHLLSPAQRPVQVTRDLASFWSSTYFEVKKDLKGRYPKHYWPDDPLQAIPTHRVRPPLERP